MKLSTRGRYGTRLMLELALLYGKGPILLKDISKSQEISLKYLGQLIIPLKIGKLIKSTRGAHGGYYLSKPPKEIKLSDIITAVEGPLSPVECIEHPDICTRSDACVTRDVWSEIGKNCFELLDSITLKDMVDRHWKKIKNRQRVKK